MLPIIGSYTFGMAQAREEGFFRGPGTRAFDNNNPGNICWDGPHGFAAAHGATHGDTGPNTPMAVFPTLAMGQAAQAALLSAPARFLNNDPKPLRNLIHGYMGARLEQVIYRWCPPESKGNSLVGTETYVRNVALWMGCNRMTILTPELLTRVVDIHASIGLHEAVVAASVVRIAWLLMHPATWRMEWQRLRRTARHYRQAHRRATAWLTRSRDTWDNTPPAPARKPGQTQETSSMKKIAAALGIAALTVTKVTRHASGTAFIVLSPNGLAPLDDVKVSLLLETSEPALIAELPLGKVLEDPTPTVDLQANGFTDFFTKKLPAFFGAHVTPDELKATEQAVIAFVGKDGLALAVDAVNYVEAKYAQATGAVTGPEKLAEAVAKFKADAETAKKEIGTLAGAALNFVLEGALQIAMSEAVKLAATVVLAAEAEPEPAS